MRNASVQALASARRELAEHEGGPALAGELFAAARVLGASSQLRAALAAGATSADGRVGLVERIFAARMSGPALAVLRAVAAGRWSEEDDAVASLEELGIRALASSSEDLDAELLGFAQVVASNHELELALNSKLATGEARAALASRLLEGTASASTLEIVRQLVLQPRGRSLRSSLRRAAAVVADEAGFGLATVTSAAPLTAERRERLAEELRTRYGRAFRLEQRLDPAVVGGVRVQVGSEVIDGTIAARLDEARLQLA